MSLRHRWKPRARTTATATTTTLQRAEKEEVLRTCSRGEGRVIRMRWKNEAEKYSCFPFHFRLFHVLAVAGTRSTHSTINISQYPH